MKRDKLDRLRNKTTAILSQSAGIPFWVTLTKRERTNWTGPELRRYFQSTGPHRKAFRDFVRRLCD